MNFALKPIHADAIPEALEKAERYRLLNEPAQAESICLDILAVDPFHRQALVVLLLAITDQFGEGVTARRAREILRGWSANTIATTMQESSANGWPMPRCAAASTDQATRLTNF